MISNKLEDYEVLSILGADLNSTCYKVKNKVTSEVFVWKAINYENFTEYEKQLLLAKIEKQKSLNHPHLLQVYDYIIQEETKIIYLISEFCANGNLTALIHKCLLENEYLNEDFLWRVLYQTACALKIRGSLTSALNSGNIFVDANYTIKLFNNNMLKLETQDFNTNASFGFIMFELCTLRHQKLSIKNCVTTTKQLLTDMPSYYSNEFKEILRFTLSSGFDLKAIVDAILCHPTILLKSTQAMKNIFIKNPITKSNLHGEQQNTTIENIVNFNIESTYQLRLENLKNRETALKMREERFSIKEHELRKREKKVTLMERSVRDKMLHAELYLKRCRETKSTSSGSNKSGPTKPKITNYEHIDTSVSADCGDSSIIIPTSKKINPDHVKKPPNFTRTLSERRVQFKGHSPLKDMFGKNNFKELRNLQHSFHRTTIYETSSTGSETAEGNSNKPAIASSEPLQQKRNKSRKQLDLSMVLPARNRKPLVDKNIMFEEKECKINKKLECRPISWTEENKQNAFDLLRIMNQNNENEVIKHTYL